MNIVCEICLPVAINVAKNVVANALTAAEHELPGHPNTHWHQTSEGEAETECFSIDLLKSQSQQTFTLSIKMKSAGDSTVLQCDFGCDSHRLEPDVRQLIKYTLTVLETTVR